MNKLFLIAAMRNRRQLSLSFEVEITAFSFDCKRMELKVVNYEDIEKARGVGFIVNDDGFIIIDCKYDFESEDVQYNIICDI